MIIILISLSPGLAGMRLFRFDRKKTLFCGIRKSWSSCFNNPVPLVPIFLNKSKAIQAHLPLHWKILTASDESPRLRRIQFAWAVHPFLSQSSARNLILSILLTPVFFLASIESVLPLYPDSYLRCFPYANDFTFHSYLWMSYDGPFWLLFHSSNHKHTHSQGASRRNETPSK